VDTATRRQALLDRYNNLPDLDRKRFNVHIGPPAGSTTTDLDFVERTLNEIEATAPRARATSRPAVVSPPPPDEGPLMNGVYALKADYNDLPDEARNWVNQLVAEGNTAGTPWNPSGLASQRRYQLGRAIVALADAGFNGEAWLKGDIVRGLLGEATGREEVEQDALPLGAAIGTLDATEATCFATLVDDYLTQ
jgi:hypothetical protein